jgi:hypothetical protein
LWENYQEYEGFEEIIAKMLGSTTDGTILNLRKQIQEMQTLKQGGRD